MDLKEFLVVNGAADELAVIGVRLLCTQRRTRSVMPSCLIVDTGLRHQAHAAFVLVVVTHIRV